MLNLSVCFFKTWSLGQESIVCKGPESILGFANQEARPKILYSLFYTKRENKFVLIFIDDIYSKYNNNCV